MKKLYLLFLALLILFMPITYGVAVYQLDQPVSELNGYTLKEVFEDSNLHNNIPNVITSNPNLDINNIPNDKLYVNMDYELVSRADYVGWYLTRSGLSNIGYYNKDFIGIKNEILDIANRNRDELRWLAIGAYEINVNYSYVINLTLLGIDYLTVEQMNKYYDLYLEAVRFQIENVEAGKDSGGYQSIFRSIINGVKGLINEMGYLWNWLNAPLITSDMSNYSFSIDWSWDLIGVIRQLMNALGVLTLQVLFVVPNLVFKFMGIPIRISILSLLFSNMVFLIIGWIFVKSFVI